MKIVEEAKSKINISLNLTGKKEDNFHDLVSFICFGNFSDKLILTESDFFDYKIKIHIHPTTPLHILSKNRNHLLTFHK